MPAATRPHYRTRQVAFRGPDGRAAGYLRLPDKADPAYQAHLDEHVARLDATLQRAAQELGLTREELAERLSQDWGSPPTPISPPGCCSVFVPV